MTTTQRRFLIVDDDPQNNMLSKMALKKSLGEVDVMDFLIPEEGLHYIQTQLSKMKEVKTILFLDINMPSMSGWEFLEEFELLADFIKRQFEIYILSSSLDPRDLKKVDENVLVIGFVEKPLRKERLLEMFGGSGVKSEK